jgi:hypothetical protein
MHLPGLPSQVYVAYLLAFMPWMAFRSMRRLRPPPAGSVEAAAPVPSRTQLFASTLVSLALLFLLTWFTAGSFGYRIFDVLSFGERELLAGGITFVACLGLMLLNRAARTPAERRTMPVYKLMPRTPAEWTLYAAAALAAGVAEEAAYRGVLMSILWYSLGNPWLAAAISAGAFGLSHAFQGWKSGVTIFAIALAMHGLVWVTGTLVVAMVVHTVYDLVAGVIGAWRVRTGRVEG